MIGVIIIHVSDLIVLAENMSEYGQRRSRRIKRGGQGHPQEDKDEPPQSNISLEEQKAIEELRKDNNRVILTADKGVSLVVMKKEEYIKKAEELLLTDTYKTISNDPTNKHKTKLIKLLKTIKVEGGSMKQFTKGSTQQGQGFPNFMGSLKCTRKAYP